MPENYNYNYIPGTAAPAYMPDELPFVPSSKEDIRQAKERQRLKNRARVKARRIAAVKRFFVCLLYSVDTAVIIASIAMLVFFMVQNNVLQTTTTQIETEVEKLTAENDSLEFAINSSINLSNIIDVATNELGMVIAGTDQITTFNSTDSEYIQQLSDYSD